MNGPLKGTPQVDYCLLTAPGVCVQIWDLMCSSTFVQGVVITVVTVHTHVCDSFLHSILIDTIAYGTGLETAHIPSNLRGTPRDDVLYLDYRSMTMAVESVSEIDELLKAIRLVLKDDGFTVPSQSAHNAAESLLELSGEQENKESLFRFATYLLTELGKCFSVCNTLKRMA